MQSTVQEIRQLISQIRKELKNQKFQPFIHAVTFAKFKNIGPDEQIEFKFPLAAIVGQNGTCKTAILHALSGAPNRKSPGKWWFQTQVDPIDSPVPRSLAINQKAAFWYRYSDESGKQLRALKTRIRRDADPDYWEPSRPVEDYGMDNREQRDPPVTMPSYYMNFKTQMSAFDRCFYFTRENTRLLKSIEVSRQWQKMMKDVKVSRRRPPRIQDYLRLRSAHLKKALVEGKNIKFGSQTMNRKRVILDNSSLSEISRIIGREYTFGAIIEHRLYETWGTSVYFRTENLNYSEAFAGSGETAVARMVHAVRSAPRGSLFLLDEPETSLHPGAQVEVVRFLLQNVLEKNLQIVLSTHSPSMVRWLPEDGIHLLTLDPSGVVRISSNIPHEEAFCELGHPVENTTLIVVEDLLSKQLLEEVAKTEGNQFFARFSFAFGHGGDSAMKQNAAVYSKLNAKRIHFIFDGDKATECGPIDKAKIPVTWDSKEIDDYIRQCLNRGISFDQDSNMTEQDKREIRNRFIEFANHRFHSLPFDAPEDVLWNYQAAKTFCGAILVNIDSEESFNKMPPKKRFARLTEMFNSGVEDPNSRDINLVQRMLIKRFCSEKTDSYNQVVALLKSTLNHD